MNAILPIVAETPIGTDTVQTVRGRDVHAFLGIGKDYTTWFRAQVERARLKQGRDFIVTEGSEVFPQKGVNSGSQALSGGRPRTEHHLTLDAAKHVGMMSGTDRGHDLREYFLECERRAKAPVNAVMVHAIPQTYAEALQAAADLARQVDRQKAEIAVLGPRSEALTVLAETVGSFCIRDAAKALQTTERGLRVYLASNGWIYRREPGGPWCARAERLTQGWMVTKVIPVETGTGKPWNRPQARITSRGLAILAMRLNKPMPPEALAPAGPLFAIAPARA